LNRNKIFIIFILIGFAGFTIFADPLSLIAKHMKLTVSDKNGGFLLYSRANTKDKWIPLLFEDEIPTSYFRFFKDQKVIPFAEGGRGRYSEIKIKDNSIVYFWNNDEIKIQLTYRLVPSKPDSPIDTLLIDLEIFNLTSDIDKINFFLCIDTYLGEQSKRPFILPDNSIITRERELLDLSGIPYIISKNEELKTSVNVILDENYIIKPDRVFFANWKKLEQNIGPYILQSDFNFDLKPYSINDSAMFIEYKNRKINLIKSNKYNFIISMKNEILLDEYKIAEKKSAGDNTIDISNKNQQTQNNTEELNLINMSLADLLALLDRINTKLENGAILTDEEINNIQKILAEIKKRRNY
jgi:hypothetical protein